MTPSPEREPQQKEKWFVTDRELAGDDLVYFIKIGEVIKIGTTKDLRKRIAAFRGTSCETIQVLETFKAGRETERFFHDLFRDERIRNEFFRDDWIIRQFLIKAKMDDLESAVKWTITWKEHMRRERRMTPWEKRLRTIAEDKSTKVSMWDALEQQQRGRR